MSASQTSRSNRTGKSFRFTTLLWFPVEFFSGGSLCQLRARVRHRGQEESVGNAVETYKASKGGDGLRIREDLPGLIERGHEALSQAEKDLLKWVLPCRDRQESGRAFYTLEYFRASSRIFFRRGGTAVAGSAAASYSKAR